MGNVLYVKADATGNCDGSSWANAFTNLASAMAVASSMKNEIWVAGDLSLAESPGWIECERDLVVRGGFAGTESAASERTAGARTTVDGANIADLVFAVVLPDITLAFEDFTFCRAKNRAFNKRGIGGIKFANCRFLNNGRENKVSGRAVYSTGGQGVANLIVTNCSFEGQMYKTKAQWPGHGAAIYLAGYSRFVCDDSLFVSNGVPIYSSGNDSRGMKGALMYVYNTPITMRRSRISGNVGCNRATNDDGGIVYVEGSCDGTAFTNCVFTGNYAYNYENLENTRCGTLVLIPSSGDRIDIESCTFAYNLSQGRQSPGALNVHNGAVTIHNSIFWHNIHGCVATTGYGADIDVKGGTVGVSHSIVTGLGIDCCHGATTTALTLDSATVYTDDPGFVTSYAEYASHLSFGASYVNPGTGFNLAMLAGIDVHLLSPEKYYLNDGSVGPATNAIAKAIDKGDPTSDYSHELGSNGSRVNLGGYGNTAEASATPSGQPKVDACTVDYPDGISRPCVTLEMGLASGSGYFAAVAVTCRVDGVVVAVKTFENVASGDVVVWLVPKWFEPGTDIEISYAVQAADATTVTASTISSTAGTSKPVFAGKGGGAGVIHVREGADYLMNGTNWTDAFPDVASALAAIDENTTEIWIASDADAPSVSFAVASPLAIRGGFAGTENSADDRPLGSRTTFDYGNATPGLIIANTAAVTLDRLVFYRTSTRAVYKSGVGDLMLRDCRMSCCGQHQLLSGRALYATGSSAATITVTNCTVNGNMTVDYKRGESSYHGAAFYVDACKRLVVDDTLFTSNGMQVVDLTGAYSYFGYVYGAALYANATPVTMRRTRFSANANGNRLGGSIVMLNGNCTGSAFTNCVWTGNFERTDNSGSSTDNSGALTIALGSTARTAEIENCTIAYNVSGSGTGAAGLNIVSGTVGVRNSILWGNRRSRNLTAGYANDIEVKGGVCTVEHSLVTSNDVSSCRAAASATLSLDANTVYDGDPSFVTTWMDFTNCYTVTSSSVSPSSICNYTVLNAFDVHLLSPEKYYLNDGMVGPATESNSVAIDKGDPSIVCTEPEPNGGRLNLGAYGNTAEASATALGQPKAESFTVTLPTEYTRPRATLVMGIESGSDYDATVVMQCVTGGVVIATKTFESVKNGTTLAWDVPFYFASGTPVSVTYTINSEGAVEQTGDGGVTAEGTWPDFAGKGGGANVVHVRLGADCLGDGTNWTDAFTDLPTALAAATAEGKYEVWIATGAYTYSIELAVTNALAIRGGFVGTENAASERPDGTRAILDNGGSLTGLVVSNGTDTVLTLDRIDFCRALNRALQKKGNGNLDIRGCRFLNNGVVTFYDGRGAYIAGGGVAEISVSDSVFSGNMCTARSDLMGSGCGLYFTSCAKATVENCLFVTNGCAFFTPASEKAQNMHGSAIYATATKLLCRNCRFAANCDGSAGGSNGGGAVKLSGACGGSAFANCAFVGNYGTIHWMTSGGSAAGALCVSLNSVAATVAITNCTFAHNVTVNRMSPGGLNVVQGTVNVVDSIFWGNMNGYFETEEELVDASGSGASHDLYVQTNGRVTLKSVLLTGTEFPYVKTANETYLTTDNVLTCDPLFVTTNAAVTALLTTSSTRAYYTMSTAPTLAAINVHLRGKSGYTDERTGEIVKFRKTHSPAIDAGDRASDYSLEPPPNGRRVNLGAYGNTPWATRSDAFGTFLIMR